jgi:predicted ATPase with chaperone activity
LADMDEKENISLSHIKEAFLYRSMDKRYWEKIL